MDLRKLRNAYLDVLGSGEDAWGDARQTARKKTVAEDIFLRLVVGWESFVSDWFIGCVNHDATRLRRSIESKMSNWLTAEVKDSAYQRYSATFPAPTLTLEKNPPLAKVRELLDPGEGNIEFRAFDDLVRRSAEELAPRFADRVRAVAGAGGAEIVDAALAIRNVLAHRSMKAAKVMNERVASFPSYVALRKKRMSKDGIGTYLCAKTASGDARLTVFRREFEQIARVLVP